MTIRNAKTWAAGVALALAAPLPASAAEPIDQACAALARTALPAAKVKFAAVVGAGRFTPAGGGLDADLAARVATLPAFCRVEVSAAPAPDSTIGIEVWLPLDRWNGRFLGTGNGGGAGAIAYNMGMIEGLKRGFAVANTDLGTAPDITLLEDHPERWNDFGHRATHEMTRVGQALTRGFYQVDSFRSYFEGCSTGGQQALVTAQRYPHDYDGILAGAPGNNRTHSSSYFLWNYQAANATPQSKMVPAQWSMVTRAVLAACAGKDGGAPGDQFLTDPRSCQFDPASLQCHAGGAAEQCLTPPQIAAVRRMYAGPVNPRTGERVYPGMPPGSEALPLGPARFSEPTILSRLFVMRWGMGKDFSAATFDFDRDLDRIDARLSSALNANNSDLNDFALRGGKLMIYSGLADAGVPFADVVQYYDRVLESSRAADGDNFARLFLVPGMGHCVGGPGVTDIGQPFSPVVPADHDGDALMRLVAWTEGGKAPDQLVARKPALDGASAQERLVCAYPALPQYSGGDPSKRGSFICTARARGTAQQPARRYLN
jgi:feruloyl esterase